MDTANDDEYIILGANDIQIFGFLPVTFDKGHMFPCLSAGDDCVCVTVVKLSHDMQITSAFL